MEAHNLYSTVLGIRPPWHVTGVRLPPGEQAVEVLVTLDSELELRCPACAVGRHPMIQLPRHPVLRSG